MKDRTMREETIRANLPTVNLYVSEGAEGEAGPAAALHYHDEIELLPVMSGTFCCLANGEEYRAEAGEVIFINARVPHETFSPVRHHYGLIQFREQDFTESEAARVVRYYVRMQSGETAARVIDDPAFFATACDLLKESTRRDVAYEIMVRADMLRILGHLYRAGILSDGAELYEARHIQKILPALEYINAHYADPLTLESVSSMLGFDRSYFCRLFREAIGTTFTDYLGFVRVTRAESLLARTEDSILDISAAVGFSSVSYFDRIFKRYRKCSPRSYRSVRYCNHI